MADLYLNAYKKYPENNAIGKKSFTQGLLSLKIRERTKKAMTLRKDKSKILPIKRSTNTVRAWERL